MSKKVFFIGINGIGMSGLAKVMAQKGFEVSGADPGAAKGGEDLSVYGIKVYSDHKEEYVHDVDLVVRSSAIKETNPEYKYALENNIETIKRGELLSRLFNPEQGIAIAGTHGKTTTSSMLGASMLSVDPIIVVGGILPEINSNAKWGSNNHFVAEADESDNSFLYLKPKYSVITNLEADHLENHGTFENIQNSFREFIDNTEKEVLVCVDDENTRELTEGMEKVKGYSIYKDAYICAKNVRIENAKSVYDVYIDGELVGEFKLSIPGDHNIANSLPVIYFSLKFGVKIEDLKEKLLNFKGAKRRYDILLDEDVKVIDDYAHHPTEIKVTLDAAKSIEEGKVIAIFQPHRYSRVKFLYEEFRNSFDKADEVILLPVYSAGEENIYGVEMEQFAKDVFSTGNATVVNGFKDVEKRVKNAETGDVFIFMGAGDISKMAYNITDIIKGEK